MPDSPETPTRSTHKSVLDTHQTLILGYDNTPMAFPIERFNAKKTVMALENGRAEVADTSWWSDDYVMGVNAAYRLPNIMRLRGFRQDISLGVIVPLSRETLYLRDEGRCQYTGVKLEWDHPDPHYRATLDHVLPVSYGGKYEWRNLVLCSAHINNNVKGEKTLKQAGLTLHHLPWEPTAGDLLGLWATEERIASVSSIWQPYLVGIQQTIRVERIREGKLYAYAA